MVVVVTGEACRIEAVNRCLGKQAMSGVNKSVPILFSKHATQGYEIEAFLCPPSVATTRLKAAFFITDDASFEEFVNVKFGGIDQLLSKCHDRLRELVSANIQKPLPVLLALLDTACLHEADKSESRRQLANTTNTITYEIQAIKKRKRSLAGDIRPELEGGVAPFNMSNTKRTMYLKARLEAVNKEWAALEAAHEVLPLGDVLAYVKITGQFKIDVDILCTPLSAALPTISKTITSIVYCTHNPASQTATDQFARHLLGVFVCAPIQHLPSIVNFAMRDDGADRALWRDCVRNSIIRLMIFMAGDANARMCALADRAFHTAVAVGPNDDFSWLVAPKKVTHEEVNGVADVAAALDKVRLSPLAGQTSVAVLQLEQRISNIIRPFVEQLKAKGTYYVRIDSSIVKITHPVCVLRALPDIVALTQAVIVDLVCDTVTRALPDFHNRLPIPLRWKFALDKDCTPPHVSAAIDDAVQRIAANGPMKEAVEEMAQRTLTDFSFLNMRKCAEGLAIIVSACLTEVLELLDIRRSLMADWISPSTVSPAALASATVAVSASAASALSSDSRFLKSTLKELQSSSSAWSFLLPESKAKPCPSIKRRFLKVDTDGDEWSISPEVHSRLYNLRKTAETRAVGKCLNRPLEIVAAVGVVERANTSFFVPPGVFTIVFCSSLEVVDSIYTDDSDRAYCVIPQRFSLRQCMLSLCTAFGLPYFLRLPLVTCDMTLFYKTISPPLLPPRRLPLQDPLVAIKQMARLLEWLGCECDGVLFGDYFSVVAVTKDDTLFGVINALTYSSGFVISRFNFL